MNIAIFASAFYPSLGGVEEAVRQICHEYQRQGVSTIVLTNRWPRSLPREEICEGIPVYRLAMRLPEYNLRVRMAYWATKAWTRLEMLRILRRHKCDLLHVHCVSANGHYALMARRALKLPLIVTAHGERTMDADQIYDRSAYLNGVLHQLLDEADHVTACSKSTMEDLEAYWGEQLGHRSSVVYSGVRLEDFQTASIHVHHRPYILAMGRMVRQKGFDVLIEAFARAGLTSHDLLLAGEGPEREGLERLACDLDMGDRVRFLGRAARSRAVALFNGCSFFVMPSRIEPMGIVNLEAMAAGKAVIASNVGGVPEIVVDEETGLLVPPERADILAIAIRRLASDEKLQSGLGRSGLERARDFDWRNIARRYTALYREAIGGPQGIKNCA